MEKRNVERRENKTKVAHSKIKKQVYFADQDIETVYSS